MTGWTWDYVERTLTVPRLKALHEEWKRHPPMARMFASYLGVIPQDTGTPEELVNRLAAESFVKKKHTT